MRGLQSISSLFGNEFNKFNNAGAGLSYDPKSTLKSCFFFVKTLRFNHIYMYATYYGRQYVLLYN